MDAPKITTIQISQELKEHLQSKGNYGESYEDIIWRILKSKSELNPRREKRGDVAINSGGKK